MMRAVVPRDILTAGAVAALAGFACRDAMSPQAVRPVQPPAFHVAEEQAVRMTGGGRIDAPAGTAEKNPPKSKVFQTFGFHVGDKDGDGLPEGNLQFVDHTPANRIGGRPLNLKSVTWHTFRRTADDCADAGIEATGTLQVKNTGEHLEFGLYACDNGEPGTKPPHDVLQLDVRDASGGVRWSWHGLLTGGNLQAHVDEAPPPPLPPPPPPGTGDLKVTTATTGFDIPQGYTLSVSGPGASTTQPIGASETVTFSGIASGDYTVALSDVAANCMVSGASSRTVTVPAGDVGSTTFDVTCTLTPPPGGVRITGLGAIGPGSATVGSNRQEFDFDVSSNLTGRVFYRDWSEVRLNGTVATLTADPADPATGIRRFRDGSDACADFTRGAEFDVTGRLDNGDLVGFTVAACDNGPAESGLDFFRIDAPSRSYSRAGFLTSGDIVKAGGGTPRARGVRVTGLGQLGTGLPLPGNDVQTFQFDVSSELVGSKFYTDWGVIRSDGTVGTLRVDPTDLGTRITAFRDGSAACADFARGVEFDGIGRVNTGGDTRPDLSELLPFTVWTCDNAMPGSGADFYELRLFRQDFSIRYEKRGVLTAGDVVKART